MQGSVAEVHFETRINPRQLRDVTSTGTASGHPAKTVHRNCPWHVFWLLPTTRFHPHSVGISSTHHNNSSTFQAEVKPLVWSSSGPAGSFSHPAVNADWFVEPIHMDSQPLPARSIQQSVGSVLLGSQQECTMGYEGRAVGISCGVDRRDQALAASQTNSNSLYVVSIYPSVNCMSNCNLYIYPSIYQSDWSSIHVPSHVQKLKMWGGNVERASSGGCCGDGLR